MQVNSNYTICQSVITSDFHSRLHFQAPTLSDSGSDSDETMRKYVLALSPPPSYYSSAGIPPQNLQNTAPESRVENGCPNLQRHNSKTRTRPYSWPQEESSTDPREEKYQERKTVSSSRNHINPGTIDNKTQEVVEEAETQHHEQTKQPTPPRSEPQAEPATSLPFFEHPSDPHNPPRPTQNQQITWNDILRATHQPPLAVDGNRPIALPQPPNFPNPIPIHRTGYDTAFLRTLPEFAHWNDPSFGEEPLSYDDYMLRAQVPIADLFQRGAVTMEWYSTCVPFGVLEGRREELEEEARGYREVICRCRGIADQVEWHVMEFFVGELGRLEGELERCELRWGRRMQEVGRAAARAAARG